MNIDDITIDFRPQIHPGRLFVFCGVDGAGKSTMLQRAFEHLRTKYPDREILVTKQPRDVVRKTELFKRMLYTENPNVDYRAFLLLTMSERVQHTKEEIEPALRRGALVICDRYVFTTLANMFARGFDRELWLPHVAGYLFRPDVSFLATVNSDLAIERINARPEEKGRFLDVPLLRKVTENFQRLAARGFLLPLDTSGSPEVPARILCDALDASIAATPAPVA